MLGGVHPARRRLIFLSAAIAALAVVLALALPCGPASAATVSAARNGVGAPHPQTISPFGVSRPVSPGQGWCEPAPRADLAAVRVLP